MSTQETRHCNVCNQDKPESEFYWNWLSRCKACRLIKIQERRKMFGNQIREKLCPRCGITQPLKKNQMYCYPCDRANHREWSKIAPNLSSYQKCRRNVLELLGGKCRKCGESDPRVLQVNHKNGLGHREVLRVGNNYSLYKQIVASTRNLDDLELLCANDNLRYEFETGRRRQP